MYIWGGDKYEIKARCNEIKIKAIDKIKEGFKREWEEKDELDRVGYMSFYMGMKHAIEVILNESEFYEY